MRLLVATNNAGKLREYRQLLQGLAVELVSPAEVGLLLEVHETGATFADNARLKAEAFAAASGLPVLADDSGLEVDALGGEPGVRSARYGGPGLTEEARYRLVLDRLIGVPWEQRGARFRCVIALAVGDQIGSPLRNSDSADQVSFAEGRCEGFVAGAPRGAHGFGYDPVFFVPEYGLTMAELAPQAKNCISHRARAVLAINAVLARQPGIERAGPAETGLGDLPPVLSEVRIRPLRLADFPSLGQWCGLTENELSLAAADEGAPPALVAELGGQAIALGAFSLHGRTAEISRLVVSPSAPVRGIDHALLNVLAEVARDRGAELA